MGKECKTVQRYVCRADTKILKYMERHMLSGHMSFFKITVKTGKKYNM